MGELSHAKEIDVKLGAGVFEGGVFHCAVQPKPGVVDQDIDATVILFDLLDRRDHVLLLSDVHLDENSPQLPDVFHLHYAPGCRINGIALFDQGLCSFLAHAG